MRLFAGTFDLKSGGNRFTGNAGLAGGGVVIESRIHELDQIVFATGASQAITTTAEGIVCDGIEFHCETRGRLKIDNQPIPVSCVMSRLRNLRERIEFVFEDGTVTLGLKAHSVPRLNGNELPVPPGFATTIIGGFRCYWNAFLRGLDDGRPNETSAHDSRQTTEWVEGIYEAMAGLKARSPLNSAPAAAAS